MDFRTHIEKKRGFWVEERSSVPCILPADGQLAIFLAKDIEALMDATYPFEIRNGLDKVWYFNTTKDREIAEADGDRIYCNPQVLLQHYLVR